MRCPAGWHGLRVYILIMRVSIEIQLAIGNSNEGY
jgi:hypothetical protein